MAEHDLPWSAVSDGVVLIVRLTPKGGRDAVDGIDRMSDGRAVLKVRVRAAPSDGEANAALVQTLARALHVAPRTVEVVAGATARVKRLRISGDAVALGARLHALTRVKA